MGSPTLADKYSLLRKLGQGGMAEVYLARQEGLQGFQKLVVIKRILPSRAEDGEFVTMFLDEARTAADLRHPNVVNIFDINRDAGTYYMAMEFLHGHDVRAVMKAQAKTKEDFPLEHALQIVMGAASGLDYAHKKSGLDGRALDIVHRDISPQNLIVGFSGEVKVVDFGIAKAASATTETEAGVVKGKFAYMAPEQARGERVDHRADQFALGAILWELLTLRRLFKRKTEPQTMMAVLEDSIPSVRMFRPDLPKELAHIVARTLERDPDKRFPDCGELRMALEDLLASVRVAHSQARLGEFMKRLFENEVESELQLSEALLDEHGHLVERNDSERSLPPPDRTRREQQDPPSRLKTPKEPPALDATRVASPKKRRSSFPSEDVSDADENTRTTTVPAPKGEPRPAPPRPKTPPLPSLRGPSLSTRVRESRGLKAALAGLVIVVVVASLSVGGFYVVRAFEKGLVIVRSDPKGAGMTVDGKAVLEETPHILKLRAGSEVQLEVTKAGYESERVRVVVPHRGEAAEVFVQLKRAASE